MKRLSSLFVVSALVCAALPSCGGGDANVFPGGGQGGGAGSAGKGGNAGAAGTTKDGGTPDASPDGSSAGTGGDASTDGTLQDAKACTSNTECQADPANPVCNTSTGKCVGCLPTDDTCGSGKYCDPATNTCATGCASDTACASDAAVMYCDLTTHKCTGCLIDDHCPAGSVCVSGACVAGCTQQHPCANSETCCGSTCVNLASDPNNCAACGTVCPGAPHASASCTASVCGLTCDAGYSDCDLSPANGCENDVSNGVCVCPPGTTQPCYEGGPGTEGVGPCHGGTVTCIAQGTGWGLCENEVLPIIEICNNGIDDDCNGVVDDVLDTDGDGWTRCQGDCCETTLCASNPAIVNPGAIEVAGDLVDNDCDGTVDNVGPTTCSGAAKFAGVTGTDVANAMDLCQFTTANPPLPQKKWGVISAQQLLADGSTPNATALSDLQNKQTAVTTAFGTGGVVPKKNATLAIISSGMARDSNDPGWVSPVSGTSLTTSITFPGAPPISTYVGAHSGALLPGHCGATTCAVGTGAYDSANIRLQIRVPTNAQGFSYDFRFFSAEYYTYQCTQYNDYFLAMLTTGAAGIPADHNISFDSLNNPVSVNNGFFQDCAPNGKNCGTCPNGTGSLLGTGFETVNGGATEWLTTDAPIVPGELMTLELVVFDVGDHILDTLVLLDNFRWSLTPVTVGTHE
ncbi:MAG: choice-of-anchor L domain-containing protein [Deltaproteobacteria bacterium]|nr:choice-of-anchor L domain-containing protein [Deltaproteobacteria bacterium]